MNLDAARPTKRIPRMYLGLVPPVRQERISRRPVLRTSVQTEHRFSGLDAGDRAGSRMNLDTGRPGSCSKLPGLYVGPEAGDVAPRMFLGKPRRDIRESTRALRVNMIRAHGGEVEVKEEEPRFGGSP